MRRVAATLNFAQRFWRSLLLTLLVPLGLAAAYVYGGGIDLVGNPQFATIDSYAFSISLFIGLVVPVGYYLVRPDLSETFALFLGLLWALFSGFQDILVYALLGRLPPAELPWLLDAPPGIVAQQLGMTTVTNTFLIGFVVVTGLATLYLMKLLYFRM